MTKFSTYDMDTTSTLYPLGSEVEDTKAKIYVTIDEFLTDLFCLCFLLKKTNEMHTLSSQVPKITKFVGLERSKFFKCHIASNSGYNLLVSYNDQWGKSKLLTKQPIHIWKSKEPVDELIFRFPVFPSKVTLYISTDTSDEELEII